MSTEPSLTTPRWTTALVTGASSGIGRSFATVLASAGTQLVVVARRRDRLEELVAELAESAPKVNVEVIVADLTDAADLATVEARLADRGRPIDLLVNNAGAGTHGRFDTLDIETQVGVIELNVVAPVRLARAALGGMVERRAGAVVNVSSLVAVKPISMWATYSSTKAFLTHFSRALDGEVREHGVRVMSVMPGFTRTEFSYPDGLTHKSIPGFLWMDAEEVARGALRDLARGKAESIPGPLYRAFAPVARITPRWLAHGVVKLFTRPLWKS